MKKIMMVMFLLTCCAAAFSQNRDLTPKEFEAIADSLDDEVIVDLRTPDEVAAGIIPGAIVIDYFGKNFEKQLATLDKSKTYLLYCASGGRSEDTLELLNKKGFTHIYQLSGGFTAWKKSGLPVETQKK